MKTIRALTLAVYALTSAAFGQGSLTPPGTPAPTMKTLDQIESRTVINSTNTPGDSSNTFIIAQSGTYYLTGNLTAKNVGIAVTASHVTVDLNGFAINTGGNSTAFGVFCDSTATNVTIRNGRIIGNTVVTGGTAVGGIETAIFLAGGRNNRVEDVVINGVTSGISGTGNSQSVSRCAIAACSSKGISLLATSSTVDHSQVSDAVLGGIQAAVIDSCTANCTSTTVANNYALTGASISNSYGSAVGGIAISAQNVSNCTGASTSNTGLGASNALNCTGTSVSGTGLFVNTAATNCTGTTGTNAATAIGLDASNGTATSCRGTGGGANSFALKANIGIGCNIADGQTVIAYKFNMP